jgi:hypothetical protein
VTEPVAPAEPVSPIAFRAPAPPPPLPPELTPVEDELHFDTADTGFVEDDIRVEHEPPAPAPAEPLAPAAQAAPAAPPAPAAPEAARPRLGLGSFADLRGASVPPPPNAVPEPAAEAAPSAAAPTPEPDLPPLLPSDKRASFAEVAQAVDSAARPAEPEPAAGPIFAEDLLPQRLPKRGRRSSRLETPWVRERPAVSTPPPASLANPVPPQRGAPQPSANGGAAAGTQSTPAPSDNGNAPAPNGAATPSADGGDRYAFFAAFRAAAEQAREEAGIDDRRGS